MYIREISLNNTHISNVVSTCGDLILCDMDKCIHTHI